MNLWFTLYNDGYVFSYSHSTLGTPNNELRVEKLLLTSFMFIFSLVREIRNYLGKYYYIKIIYGHFPVKRSNKGNKGEL